jgi:hypothetical protein
MTLWIPKDLYSGLKTMDIASTMIQDFGVSQINNDTYNDNFNEYYDRHIKENETAFTTFCSKNGKGINSQYLIDNANKDTYVTLLSLDIDPDNPDNFTVLASIVFKWSPTAGSVKIQAFCSNQKLQSKGAGTKLLNFLKKVLRHMNINNIYLNPIRGAIPYYSSQQFVEAKTPKKKVYDTSSSKSTTKSKSKSKTKSPKSKSKSKPNKIPTMTINLRAAKNWKKAKTKMSSVWRLAQKKYGKTHEAKEKNVLLAKIDEIVDNLSSDHREMAQYQDIIDIFNRSGRHLNDKEEDIVIKHLRNKYNIY